MGVPKSLDYKDFMSKSTSANPTTWDDMYRFFGNQGEITAALVKSLLYQPDTAYSSGAIVYSPNLPAGTIAKCTVAGTTGSTEPAWTAAGSAVNDGTVRWLVENSGGSNITVDAILDSISSNAIANKAVYAALNNKLDKNGTAMYAYRDSAGNIIKDTYAKKSEVSGVVKSVNNIAPDSNGNVTITVSGGGGGGGSGDYLPLTGGTVTGGITATNFQTGTGEANYFQCRKFRGEGNANSYYHAIDFGYSGHDSVDFYEYDPNWNFYKCTTGTKSGAVLVGNINGNGWNGGARLTGTPTAPTASVGTNTTQIATTAFVQAAIPKNVSSFSNDAGYIKSVNNTKPDASGNVTITVSGGGSGSGVSTSTQNTWTAQQSFDLVVLNVEKYKTSYDNGNSVKPSSVTAVYNATGSFTLDLRNFSLLLSIGQSLVFTAYIKANADYPLTITNGGTLKYIGSPSDLAITSAGLLLNIFITLDNSGNQTSIVQASKLS